MKSPHTQELQPVRTKGITIIGAISNQFQDILYSTGQSTNIELTNEFLETISENVADLSKTVVVLDNHSVHTIS